MPLYRNRAAALLAVLAMALQGFLPALAQAQANDSALFGTICSVDGGTRTVDLSGGGLPAGGAGKHQKHCALCVAGGDRVQALVSAPIVSFQSPAFLAETPAALPAVVVRSTVASPAQPRAPPVQI